MWVCVDSLVRVQVRSNPDLLVASQNNQNQPEAKPIGPHRITNRRSLQTYMLPTRRPPKHECNTPLLQLRCVYLRICVTFTYGLGHLDTTTRNLALSLTINTLTPMQKSDTLHCINSVHTCRPYDGNSAHKHHTPVAFETLIKPCSNRRCR